MKAVMQNFRNGDMKILDVPPPTLQPGGVLVKNVTSLISAGTEKAVIELAKMNPLQKAKARPDLVKKVLNRAGQEGLIGTAQIVLNLVSTPLPLGYSCAGIVDKVGSGVTEFQPSRRVACAGLGYANHAEVVFVPRNLTVGIPDTVSFDEAAFVTVGAIALHGVRQAEVMVGENVVIIGLGLVGQLTAQLCAAAGCNVFGTDLSGQKVQQALELGMQAGQEFNKHDLVAAVRQFTKGQGADAILITAATSSSEPIELAAELARDRAKVVAVGDVGLDIPRRAYYEKELDLRLSRSYGPGRYDVNYEEKGIDYPAGYVRWTENRNMAAFLELIAQGKVQLTPFITHRFGIEDAESAYKLLESNTPYTAILLDYNPNKPQPSSVQLRSTHSSARTNGQIRLGVIGAGQFAQGILMPKLRGVGDLEIVAVATGKGLTARSVADKYKSTFATSDYHEILQSPDVNAVLIATRHDLHAGITSEALQAGKHVFVEKPLAVRAEELDALTETYRNLPPQAAPILMVGFNRRFSPLALKLKEALGGVPLIMNYRINAGVVPGSHWAQDAETGGGRIVGEVCHFIDLMQFLTGANVTEVFAVALGKTEDLPADPDNIAIQLCFEDGSLGTIIYAADGDSRYPKERLEVFGGGGVGVIDNWRQVEIWKNGKHLRKRAVLMAAKGHSEELIAFADGLRAGKPPITFESLRTTTLATFAIQHSLRLKQVIALSEV